MKRSPIDRKKWSEADRSLAGTLHDSGASVADIASALGRKPDAVRAWLHHNCRVWTEPTKTEYQRADVPHADIPTWHALGWRFAGFEGDRCIFEWRASGRARMPNIVNSTANELEMAA
jgi:hypothetical protein